MKRYNRRPWRKKEKKENEKNDKKEEKIEIPVSKDIDVNLEKMKEILVDCDDIIYREINGGEDLEHRFAIVYTDGLTDKELISDYALESLMHQSRMKPTTDNFKHNLYELAKKGNVAVTEVSEVKSLEKAIDFVLIGETILLVDGFKKIMILSSRGWPMRGLSEPQTETVIRGPRDGFVETSKINTSLIRRRIRDPKLKLKYMQIGKRSKTDVAVMYIEDIVNDSILKEVKTRLKKIKIDAILESSYIEQLIEDNWLSPFPQLESTERPDAVAAALYEGRVALVIDNTPFTLLAPATFSIFMQSSEDYYDRWPIVSIIRLIRYLSLPLALLLPSLYIAITSYHPGMLPTALALYVASTRMGVPFPAFIEAFIMELTLEILREAGTRLSGPIGTTIGIVGGLVIGQAAVEAGIVSPLMVIIVAVTTIASFALPSNSFAAGFRLARFFFMLLAAVLGLYGIMLGLVLLGTHLVSLKSFGIPYFAPYSSAVDMASDLKDSFIRVPVNFMRKRPVYMKLKDKNRMKASKEIYNEKDEDNDRK
ncbi:MAG: spore germination protein [Firmicutes bacterium]|nr:spore germination protein [Bacillota bacterium]